MALIACPECGREVSDRAVSCPGCAYPLQESPQDGLMPDGLPYVPMVPRPHDRRGRGQAAGKIQKVQKVEITSGFLGQPGTFYHLLNVVVLAGIVLLALAVLVNFGL